MIVFWSVNLLGVSLCLISMFEIICSRILSCIAYLTFTDQCPSHTETSQLICRANQLSCFNLRGTLVVKGLRGLWPKMNPSKALLWHLKHYMGITWTVNMFIIDWVSSEDILILYKTDDWKSRQSICSLLLIIQVQD